ncbi:hypothetical protein [Azomonas macrocytogenes]|uniref:Secreted protein n=1 Tax=Azomonas macrocytogenes TaxID=69962 RepID=A0A839T4B4_AZOMA|nr:hypothetical protein [Azomonas macrocytogenes]MBB3103928.1 hypothetical protein [Azomonas macrocytogenes]
MRITRFIASTLLTCATLSAYAADSGSLQSKCQEQKASQQQNIDKVGLLGQLLENKNIQNGAAQANDTCNRVASQQATSTADANQQATKVTNAVDSVQAASNALGSLFGK